MAVQLVVQLRRPRGPGKCHCFQGYVSHFIDLFSQVSGAALSTSNFLEGPGLSEHLPLMTPGTRLPLKGQSGWKGDSCQGEKEEVGLL